MSQQTSRLVFVLVFALAGATMAMGAGTGRVPAGLSASDWNNIRAEYESNRHAVVRVGNEYHAHNARQQWLTRFDERGFLLEPKDGAWRWGLELESYGYAGQQHPVKGPAQRTSHKERVVYSWDSTIEEWFVNDSRGLEHGFTVRKSSAAASRERGKLTLHLAVRGGLRPQGQADGRGVSFLNAEGKAVVEYAGLKVWDADGKVLSARLAAPSNGLRLEIDDRGAHYPITIDPLVQQAYLKASNTGTFDRFGYSVATSGDTVVVGAYGESSSTSGVNSTPNDAATSAGAAYVFVRNAGVWIQQAYLKASNPGSVDTFGTSVAISGDTIVVGAPFEWSSSTGVNSTPNEDASRAGAAYVFVRNAGVWSQQAYLKASNAGSGDEFGTSVAISGDTVVVGAWGENSSSHGVNSTPNEDAPDSGAAYVFVRNSGVWTQQAYLKASNNEGRRYLDPDLGRVITPADFFGQSVAISGDTVVVGAPYENSSTTGINSTPNEVAENAGAAYVFVRNSGVWSEQAYLKASNAGENDLFGFCVGVSGDTVVVGAWGEASNATGVNGNQNNNTADRSGAAYVFVRNAGIWSQQAYLKASNAAAYDQFGASVAISDDTIVVGADGEDSSSTGINSSPNDGASEAGAAHLFVRNAGVWSQRTYLKASNPGASDYFGIAVAVSGDTVVAGADFEDSSATGINGNQIDNSAAEAGAVYVFSTSTTACGSGRTMPVGQWTMFSLPCAADAPSTVSSVFSGLNSAAYDQDWVVYERNEDTDSYVKLNLNSGLSQGNGYWFKSMSPAQFSVTGTSTPVGQPFGCGSSAGCFQITLTPTPDSDGLYNLAGHPFPYNVDWASVKVQAYSNPPVSMSQAATNGYLSGTFWIWNGSGYDAYDDSTPGLAGQLMAFHGMWVKVLNPGIASLKLLIPASEETTSQAAATKAGALKANEWYVRLVAEAPAEGLKDRGNVLGQLKDGKYGFDKHDLWELAPGFTPYLTLVFRHATWGAKSGDYASDFHTVKTGADSWSFVVRSDNPNRVVKLSWEVTGKAPANMSLKDVRTGKLIARKAGSYTFTMGGQERAFTWLVR